MLSKNKNKFKTKSIFRLLHISLLTPIISIIIHLMNTLLNSHLTHWYYFNTFTLSPSFPSLFTNLLFQVIKHNVQIYIYLCNKLHKIFFYLFIFIIFFHNYYYIVELFYITLLVNCLKRKIKTFLDAF